MYLGTLVWKGERDAGGDPEGCRALHFKAEEEDVRDQPVR